MYFGPNYDSDPYTGVSTLDLVMIQQHILNIRPFDNPYDIIASDVTNNDKISSSDLLTMRKMILGIIPEWPNDIETWVFVDSAHVFQDETEPFYYPDSIVIETLLDTMDKVNFVAIKMGDVNGSFNPTFEDLDKGIASRNNAAIEATINIIEMNQEGRQYEMGFEHIEELVDGMQFSIQLPKDATVHSDYLEADDYVIIDDVLKVSWINSGFQYISDGPFLTITSNLDSDLLLSQDLVPEIYINLEPHTLIFENVELSSKEESQSMNTSFITVVQNPFVSELELIINDQSPIQLEVYDAHGRRVITQNIEGQNELLLDNNYFQKSGLYILRASNGSKVQTIKVVKI